MAVHTILSKNELVKILSNYNIGDLISFKGILEGIENTNYILTTEKDKFILTIFEDRINYQSIPFYISVMQNSFEKGVNCPFAIKDNRGNSTNSFKEKEFGIFKFVEGKSKKEYSEKDCFEVGKIMANFHKVNKNIKNKHENSYSLRFWIHLFKECKNSLNIVIPGSQNILEDEIKFITKYWPKELPKGIIHADMFPDNVLFYSKEISGIIDFYFSCYDFLSYDLAILINAWCFQNNKFNIALAKKIVQGYESVRKITIKEKKKFNILLRGACLRFLLTRVQDSKRRFDNKMLNIKNPIDFYERLLFHKNMSSNYGFF